jgi:hypothetical protein
MTTNRVRKSDGQQEALKRAREAAAETLSLRHAVEASSAAAPVDSGTDPPPAGRFRRSCRTLTAQVQSGRPRQLPPLLRTARWRLVEAMPQYVYQPHPPGSHAHAQHSASRCVHRCARHARTTCTRLRCGAGCFGGLCSTDRALHVGRAAARLAGPAAVCLPRARARARSTGLRPGYGCSPAMPDWLRMPAMLKALRSKTTRVACR